MACSTAGRSARASGTQRTEACWSARETSALATPATLWMASVTCRTQLLQVMPPTDNSVRAVVVLSAMSFLSVGMELNRALARFQSNNQRVFRYLQQPTTKMNLCQTKTAGLVLVVVLQVTPSRAQESATAAAPLTPVPPAQPAVAPAGREVGPGVLLVGHISHPRIPESSGVVASRQFPGVLW